jgi:hypothetical protein
MGTQDKIRQDTMHYHDAAAATSAGEQLAVCRDLWALQFVVTA